MSSTFIAKISDVRHRIVLPNAVWEVEDLQVGDYLEVTITKLRQEKKN